MERNVLVGGEVLLTHPSSTCVGQYCTIHNNSNHHMRDWHQHWREDRHLIERICPHGVGHPDPDEINSDTTHGCDGCCIPPEKEETTLELKQVIIDYITSQIVEQTFPKEGEENAIHWDASDDKSEYSVTKEFVGSVVESTFKAIQNWEELDWEEDEESGEEDESDTEEPQEDDLFATPPRDRYGKYLMNKSEGAVVSHANFFIFMDAGPGVPHYVKDVREWLRRVDELKISDDTEVEGTLHLTHDFDNTVVEQIECGECYQYDIITETHHCDGRWSERYEALQEKKSQQET